MNPKKPEGTILSEQDFSGIEDSVREPAPSEGPRGIPPGRPGIQLGYRLFFKESLRSLRLTASVFPSSGKLASALARPIDFERARIIVELGPGTGVITREILKRLHPDAKLFAIDLIPAFIHHLRATCHDPRLIPVRGSATDLQDLLAAHDVRCVDAVVSSLPLTAMDEETRTNVMLAIGKCLTADGSMTQCQWELARLRPSAFREERFLREFFGDVSVRRVLLNLPPTLVFTCRKWKRQTASGN